MVAGDVVEGRAAVVGEGIVVVVVVVVEEFDHFED